MIINAGARTDISIFFSRCFLNRISEGFVLVKNPYYPAQVTRYPLDPKCVDALFFCTKNPAPLVLLPGTEWSTADCRHCIDTNDRNGIK